MPGFSINPYPAVLGRQARVLFATPADVLVALALIIATGCLGVALVPGGAVWSLAEVCR